MNNVITKLKKKVPNKEIICSKGILSNWEYAYRLLFENGEKDNTYSVKPTTKGKIKILFHFSTLL